jgi:hypothetical protein
MNFSARCQSVVRRNSDLLVGASLIRYQAAYSYRHEAKGYSDAHYPQDRKAHDQCSEPAHLEANYASSKRKGENQQQIEYGRSTSG